VFSNILLTSASLIYFIDMRGKLGSTLTLEGDAMYDYGKVFQSLWGYDFHLLGANVEPAAEYLQGLRRVFLTYLSTNFPSFNVKDLKVITASLYFSLIPLHQDKQSDYFKLVEAIMKDD
jgi:hypothetical protein